MRAILSFEVNTFSWCSLNSPYLVYEHEADGEASPRGVRHSTIHIPIQQHLQPTREVMMLSSIHLPWSAWLIPNCLGERPPLPHNLYSSRRIFL